MTVKKRAKLERLKKKEEELIVEVKTAWEEYNELKDELSDVHYEIQELEE